MPDVREVYEMVTKQKPPEPGALERQQKRQIRAARNQKIGALAVAAAICLAAIALFLVTDRGGDTTVPATTPSPIDVVDPAAVEVAVGFVQAYGHLDADRAIAYLAADADVAGLTGSVGSSTAGIEERVRLHIAWLEATGYKQIGGPCDSSAAPQGAIVHCPFEFQTLRSDQLGLGPYGGSSFDLTVRDGKVVQVAQNFETGKFSPQVWEPFAAWVAANHPDDVAVMYTSESQTDFRLTDASIRIWGQLSK
jgi:hypothetical protein